MAKWSNVSAQAPLHPRTSTSPQGNYNETVGFEMKQRKRNERIAGYFQKRASPIPPTYSYHVSGREGRGCEKHKCQESPQEEGW